VKTVFKVGDKVKLTIKFLRSTGQYVGGEGHKRWTVKAVGSGEHPMVTVDESRADLGYWTKEELAADPMLQYRRIAACNLMLASKPDHD
jgi:hypothetical protein